MIVQHQQPPYKKWRQQFRGGSVLFGHAVYCIVLYCIVLGMFLQVNFTRIQNSFFCQMPPFYRVFLKYSVYKRLFKDSIITLAV